MGDVQKKLQELSDSYQSLQAGATRAESHHPVTDECLELSTAVEARQKLESQQQENTTVQKVRLDNPARSRWR